MQFTQTALGKAFEILLFVQNNNPKNTIRESELKEIYSYCLEMGWIEDRDNKLYLTIRGQKIINSRSPEYLRLQIEDYISIHKPRWADDLHKGTIHSKYALPNQVYTIFETAGLMGSGIDKMRWLSKFIIAKYGQKNAITSEIGLEGEELIYYDEINRVGDKSVMYCGDNTELGYDIKSIRNIDGVNKDIFIEVKAGNKKLEDVVFYLSRNQWSTSFSHKNYFIFVVSLIEKKYLQLSAEMLRPYVPDFPKKRSVDWEKIKIKSKNIFKDMKSEGIDLSPYIIDIS